jgi:hypothetical protein
MTSTESNRFSSKKDPGDAVNPEITAEVTKEAKRGELPCAVAFKIAEKLSVSPAEVGRAADALDVKLVKCQLGLFGYSPRKRIVSPSEEVEPALKDAVLNALENERLPCKRAWEIAALFNVRKMTVSNACEALGIKIKPCQLGAF